MVKRSPQHSEETRAPQETERDKTEANKIGASTQFDFSGKNLTPYGGLLRSRRIKKLLHLADQLLILLRTGLGKTSDHLRGRDIVDPLHVNNGSISPVFANRRGQPLKAFFVHWIAGQ